MGADLYILRMDRDKQYTGYRTDTEVGYFRDSYNNWNLLWQFDMSWWIDINLLTRGTYRLTPTRAKKLLKILKEKEPVFKENLSKILTKVNYIWDYTFEDGNYEERTKYAPNKELDREEAVKYYEKHYKDFIKFLNKAIELKSDIECSC